MKHLLTCKNCDIYTMKEKCPKCCSQTVTAKPAKFSPEDKFGYLRRKAKQEELGRKGLI